jgi:hypothetical protein
MKAGAFALDLAAFALPCMLLVAAIDYVAWCAWWI